MKCCDLNAGKLRHRITIQREQKTPDGLGGSDVQWSDLYSPVQAFVKPISGNEFIHSMRLEARISHTVYIRYLAALRPTDKIVFNAREFQIRAIINVEERNKWLEIRCEEGVAQ